MPFRILRTIVVCSVAAAAQPLITPSTPPAVNQGSTFKFQANEPVTWSMAYGSLGRIDADGTYHAPASVSAKQSLGGCQVLPNNHVVNTRVDALPVNRLSSTWIAAANSSVINYLASFPINSVDPTAPLENMVFAYTPGNNGPFRIPQYPDGRIQSGWFAPPFSGVDRHLLAVRQASCVFQEMYNYYKAGENTYNHCPLCTSQSGVKYLNYEYDLPKNGGVDAASMYVMPLTLHLQEIERALATGGAINHALRFTLSNAHIATAYIWPAMSHAYPKGSPIPYGARFRLKAGFDTTKFSPASQILLKQLKEYGIILTDGGLQWQIATDLVKFPPAIQAAFKEIYGQVKPTDMEAVDESSLMLASDSGDTNVDAETVIATSVASPSKKSQIRVVLTGVTIGLPVDQLYIQAGTGPQQLTAWVKGTANPNVNWSLSPALGTLAVGGWYTPPAQVAAAQMTTVTAASATDPSVIATQRLTVLPAGTIRIATGRASPYTDSTGKVWQASTGDDGGWPYTPAGPWPSIPDIALYEIPFFTYGDMRYDITVPNGTYQITGKFAETEVSGPGKKVFNLESQGQVIYWGVDVFAVGGGKNQPVDFQLPATVTDGHLAFVIRGVSGPHTNISALEIAPDSGLRRLTITPTNGGTISKGAKKQFYAAAWFMGSGVTWSLSPNLGSIDATGLYTAPAALSANTVVTITATSQVDSSKKAAATVTVLH